MKVLTAPLNLVLLSLWTLISGLNVYGKEVYKLGHDGKDMFQASLNFKDLGLR